MDLERVLIASPVRQKPAILEAFLKSAGNIRRETVLLDYMFIDDNDDPASTELLNGFRRENSTVFVQKGAGGVSESYVVNDRTHYWTSALIYKVAGYKNAMIEFAVQTGYDYIFFIDSDIVVHPNLIEHLKAAGKDVIAEIFWTKWQKESPELPNVWMYNLYDFADPGCGKPEAERRAAAFLSMLEKPGVYEVGGLGACTLISRNALKMGASFTPVRNLTIWGEDRAFCIRAVVLGLGLFVDTTYPAYHIYRESLLDGLQEYMDAHGYDV